MNTKAKANETETETKINKTILSRRNKTMKITKALTALTLALLLAIGIILPVLAAGDPVYSVGEAGVEVVIAKRLRTGIATETPGTTFTFVATPYSFDGVQADANKLPTLGTGNLITITYPAGNLPGQYVLDGTDYVKYVYRESGNIFAGVTFTQAGEYTWRIKEQAGGFTNTSTAEMIYNTTTEYEVTAYVQQKADGSGYFVWAVAAKILVLDQHGGNGNSIVGDKVDPRPGNPSDPNWNHSGMVFTNRFVKKGEPPVNPLTSKNSLSVLKRVAGSFKDENAYFKYQMSFKKNIVSPTETYPSTTFIAYIVNTNISGVHTSIVTGATTPSLTSNNIGGTGVNVNTGTGMITIPYGITNFTFDLKANQSILFFEMYVGSDYKIDELTPTNYTPGVNIKYYDKKSAYRTFTKAGSLGVTLSAPNDEDTLDPSLFFIGETTGNPNAVEFTNTRNLVTPTGLNINDLPFIGMIVLAIAGVTGYVGYRLFKNSRKRKALSLEYNQ